MVKIQGAAYVIIGCLVAAMSYYIDKQNDASKLVMFVYVGLVMVAVGIVKIVIRSLTKDRPARIQRPAQQMPHQAHHGFCPFCGSQMNNAGAYCQLCGARVR